MEGVLRTNPVPSAARRGGKGRKGRTHCLLGEVRSWQQLGVTGLGKDADTQGVRRETPTLD